MWQILSAFMLLGLGDSSDQTFLLAAWAFIAFIVVLLVAREMHLIDRHSETSDD